MEYQEKQYTHEMGNKPKIGRNYGEHTSNFPAFLYVST